MQEQQQSRRIPLAIVAGLSAVVLAAGGGTAWWAWNSGQSSKTPPATTTSQLSPSPQRAQASSQKSVQIYWLKNSGNRIQVVPSSLTLQDTNSKSAVLEDAFKSLLAGPTEAQFTTTIPQGTKLRGVEVKDDGVHIDLSQEFTSGGGSASMTGRVAQVLYTATSLNPDAKVWIDVEGKKLEVLGGEGLELEQPLTRKNFQEDFEL